MFLKIIFTRVVLSMGGGPYYDRNLERKEWNSRNIELFKGGRRSKKRRMRIRRKKEQPFHLYYLIQILYEKYNLINI